MGLLTVSAICGLRNPLHNALMKKAQKQYIIKPIIKKTSMYDLVLPNIFTYFNASSKLKLEELQYSIRTSKAIVWTSMNKIVPCRSVCSFIYVTSLCNIYFNQRYFNDIFRDCTSLNIHEIHKSLSTIFVPFSTYSFYHYRQSSH